MNARRAFIKYALTAVISSVITGIGIWSVTNPMPKEPVTTPVPNTDPYILCPTNNSPYVWTPIGTFSENFNWTCLENGYTWTETYPEETYQRWREAFLTAEYVRDYTILYLLEIEKMENLPDPLGLTWSIGSVGNGETKAGYKDYRFSADGIFVSIGYPVVAPENTAYKISIKIGGISIWEGELFQREFIPYKPITPVSEEESLQIAREFVRNSPTFQFDGIYETLIHVSTYAARCPYCWNFIFTFESRHAGYGDRTGQMLAQVITPHIAQILVHEGSVESATMDGKWDMINQQSISSTPSPTTPWKGPPPQIFLIYQGEQFYGAQASFSFKSMNASFPPPQSREDLVSFPLIEVVDGSEIAFKVDGYHEPDKYFVTIFSVEKSESIFEAYLENSLKIELPSGIYYLSVSAYWTLNGYVSNVFKIEIPKI